VLAGLLAPLRLPERVIDALDSLAEAAREVGISSASGSGPSTSCKTTSRASPSDCPTPARARSRRRAMSSPAVPLTQARSSTRRLPRPALAHQRAPPVMFGAVALAADRLPREPDVIRVMAVEWSPVSVWLRPASSHAGGPCPRRSTRNGGGVDVTWRRGTAPRLSSARDGRWRARRAPWSPPRHSVSLAVGAAARRPTGCRVGRSKTSASSARSRSHRMWASPT